MKFSRDDFLAHPTLTIVYNYENYEIVLASKATEVGYCDHCDIEENMFHFRLADI